MTMSNECGNHANQYLACNRWKFCSIVRFGAFAERDVENHCGAHKVPSKKSYMVFVRAAFYRRYVGIYWRRSHQTSLHHEAEEFSLSNQDQGGANQTNWLCPHDPNMFSTSWISLKASSPMPQTDSWLSPPPPHVGTQAPELEPLALVACVNCRWVHSKPLQPQWACASFSLCCGKASGLLHQRNRWNSRARRPAW